MTDRKDLKTEAKCQCSCTRGGCSCNPCTCKNCNC
jgi:hypothetical protein